MAKKNCSSIGGQAVIEGVMMRGPSCSAVAVRDPDGKIQVETERFKPFKERNAAYRIPVVRGVVNFVSSMAMGMKTLTRSTEVYGEDIGEPSKAERWMERNLHVDLMKLTMAVGVILGIVLAVVLFVLLPQYASRLVWLAVGKLRYNLNDNVYNLIDALMTGVFKIAIFVIYLLLVSLMKEIKRVFMYHGAEHKVISCYEHGLELTVENAKKMSRQHDRCGTSFIFIILTVSILFFALFFSLVPIESTILKVAIRIAFIPLLAGVSYEVLKFMAKFDNPVVRALKAPGLALQKLTTAEPTDDMLEVSIAAFSRVMDMEENKELADTKFVLEKSVSDAKDELVALGIPVNEAEIILMKVTATKTRSELSEKGTVALAEYGAAKKYAKERLTGKPLQYVLSNVCFYGLDLYVDKNVLIPRPETEMLVEVAINAVKGTQNPKILDLCTGSGAVAVALSKELSCEVSATDISEDALSVAKENAAANKVKVRFEKSDLFEQLAGKKFNLITANPPYVKSVDMFSLPSEVKEYEPRIALDGGEDGLDFYRRLAAEIYGFMLPAGVLVLEVGIGQAEAVKELFADNFDVEIIKDLEGIDRIVKGVLK